MTVHALSLPSNFSSDSDGSLNFSIHPRKSCADFGSFHSQETPVVEALVEFPYSISGMLGWPTQLSGTDVDFLSRY